MRIISLVILLLAGNLLKGQEQQDTLTVLTFDDYYGLVLNNHPIVKQANLLPRQAAQQLRLARGSFDPKLEGNFDFKELKGTEYFNKLGASLKIPTWFPINPKVGFDQNSGRYLNAENFISDETENQQIYAGISLPIGQGLFIDQRRATVRQAQIFQDMAEAEQIKDINKILLTATKDYWQWYYAYNNYVLMLQSIALAQDIFDRTKMANSYGEAAPIDTVQAKITLLGRITAMQQANIDRIQAGLMLSNHLWAPDGSPLEVLETVRPDTVTMSGLPEGVLAQLVEMARENHPEIRKLDLKNQSLVVDRKLARENLKPRLDLNYTLLDQPFNAQGQENDIILDENYKVGVDFSFPIFLRKERAKLAQTNLKLTDNTYQRNFTELQIINEVNSQYNNVLVTGQILDQQFQMVQSYQQILQAERLNLANGESDLFKLNIQIDKLIESQTKLLKLQSEYEKNVAELYWAAGVANLGFTN